MNASPTEIRTLDVLNDHIRACGACTLRAEAASPVPGNGLQASRVAILGRNPGRDEDVQGKPFVGRGGAALRRVLRANGIEPERLWITNTAKCYSLNDRPPTDEEYNSCVGRYLIREFRILAPQIIVVLGNDAFRKLTGVQESVTRHRKRYLRHKSLNCLVAAIVHPGYAVRNPNGMKMMEEDFAWLANTSQFLEAYGELNPFTE